MRIQKGRPPPWAVAVTYQRDLPAWPSHATEGNRFMDTSSHECSDNRCLLRHLVQRGDYMEKHGDVHRSYRK